MKNVKVKVTFEFDLPMDDTDIIFKECPSGIVRDIVYDDVTNFVVTRHLIESCENLCKAKDDKNSPYYKSYMLHKMWADLLKNGKIWTELDK